MKKYVKPSIAMVNYNEFVMAAMSTHDEIGDGQLGKPSFSEDEQAPASDRNIWDD